MRKKLPDLLIINRTKLKICILRQHLKKKQRQNIQKRNEDTPETNKSRINTERNTERMCLKEMKQFSVPKMKANFSH